MGGRGGEQRERSKMERARTMQSRTEKEKENRERVSETRDPAYSCLRHLTPRESLACVECI